MQVVVEATQAYDVLLAINVGLSIFLKNSC